jgi:signal transduction histidine kinase
MYMTFSFNIALFLLVILTTVGIGILVVAKNPRSIVNQSFAIFLLGIVLSTFGFLCLALRLPFELFDRAIHYGGVLFTSGLLCFSYVFPDKKVFPKKTWPLYIPAVFFLCVVPFKLLVQNATFNAAGDVATTNGPLFIPYIFYYLFCFTLIVFSITRTYKKVKGRAKAQVQYLLAGISVMLFCLLTFNLILPIFGVSYLYAVGPLSSLVFIYATAYSIIQHELMDIRIVLQRGIIYTILSAMVITLYVSGLQLLSHLLSKATSLSAIISGGITTIIGVFFIRPLEDRFRKITDPIFFKDRYNYADVVQELSNILYTNLTTSSIVRESSQLLERTLKPTHVVFRFKNDVKENGNSSHPNALSIPIIFVEQQIGVIELGPKRSGDAYNITDTQLLETFACQAAIALEKGRLLEQVERYNSHLEELIEERTHEIKKLQEDQKQAMIDVSHNLQTPLAVIQGELELLDEPVFESKIFAVKKSLDRVSEFIRQLLHLSRLDHSIYKVELSSLDLGKLLNEQVEYFEVMALEKGVRINCTIPEDIYILGNKRLLGELFVNLVVNAIAYRHPERKNEITITLIKNNNEAHVCIEDNGVGIAKKDIPELFTRFYRGARTSKSLHGTGLGLAICKTIVEKHKGTISVSSNVGEKTVFTIIFPLDSKLGV